MEKRGLAAILSFNLHTYVLNYGSALQSYALQTYLKKCGKESVIIDYVPTHAIPYLNKKSYFGKYTKFWHPTMFFKMQRWSLSFYRRYQKFQHFFKKNYNTTKYLYRDVDFSSLESIEGLPIDTYVCGSDTIWKVDQTKGFNHVLFLDFSAANKARKVSYAPSMGARSFTDKEIEEFRALTSGFTGLSVREKTISENLSNYLDKAPLVVCDPSLLLDADDYESVTKTPQNKGYVFLYVCEETDTLMVQEARKFAKSKNLKVVEVTHFFNDKYLFDHTVINDCGVEEWLGYIKNADYVITNSFHGCCFSVIFKKQVLLFERNKTDFKMPDLVETLGMKQCIISCDNKVIPSEIMPIDYDQVYSNLSEFRKVSYKFIEDNIL